MGRLRAVAVLAGIGMSAYWAGEAAEVRIPRLFGWMAGLALGLEYVSLAFLMSAMALTVVQLIWGRRRKGWWKRVLLVAGAASLLVPLGVSLGQNSLLSVVAAMAAAAAFWTALGKHAADRSTGTGNLVPALLVSVCLQVGIGLIASERLGAAAALAAFGTWMYLWGRKLKGWVKTRREAERWPVGVRVAGVLALAVVLCALAVVRYPAPVLQAETKKSNGDGSGAPRGSVKSGELTGTVGGGDWPGVVVYPEAERHAVIVPPLPNLRTDPFGRRQSRLDPVSIPFFGAYWYFREPHERPPDGSPILRGTPERMRFLTWDEGPIQMEARQNLSTFIDLGGCGAVQLAIRNADGYPGTVWMKLMLADTKKLVEWDLGEQEVRSVPRWRSKQTPGTEETLTFPLKGVGPVTRFDEFRVVYRMKPMRWGRSPKIAITRFVLLPRTGLAGPV